MNPSVFQRVTECNNYHDRKCLTQALTMSMSLNSLSGVKEMLPELERVSASVNELNINNTVDIRIQIRPACLITNYYT